MLLSKPRCRKWRFVLTLWTTKDVVTIFVSVVFRKKLVRIGRNASTRLRDRFNIRPTFERISRVGKPSSPQHPRDIIVRFSSFSVRDQILRNRIFINEDFCPGTVEVRKNQMEKYHAARSGKFVFFNYRTLVVKEPRSGSGSENTKVSSAGLTSTTPPTALSASPNDVSRSASDVAAASLALPTPLRDTPRDNQPRFRKQTDFFKPS